LQRKVAQRLRHGVAAARANGGLRRWSRPKLASAAGVTALIAGGAAAALVAMGGGPAQSTPVYRDAALSTQHSELGAIFKLHPNLAEPVVDLIQKDNLPKPVYAGDHGRVGVPKGVLNPTTTAGGAVTGFLAGPSSGDFTPLQLASLALRAGCSASQAVTAAAIAAAESGGNPGAQGDISLMDSTWDWSEGLWQIRGLRSERGTGELRDSLANADPVTNASAMYAISSGCTNWTPWTTYTSGAYLAYLPMMKSAVESAVGYKVKTGAYPPIGSGDGPATVPSASRARSAGHHGRHGAGGQGRGHSRRSGGSRHGSGGGRSPHPQPSRTSAKPTADPSPTPSRSRPLPTKSSTLNPKPSLTSIVSSLTSILPSLPTSLLPSSLVP
jgi:hypothetical protein